MNFCYSFILEIVNLYRQLENAFTKMGLLSVLSSWMDIEDIDSVSCFVLIYLIRLFIMLSKKKKIKIKIKPKTLIVCL